MHRVLGWVIVLFSVVGAVDVDSTLSRMLFLSVAGVALWRAMRCAHPGPLALLPAVAGETGARSHARWYCDACGRSWPVSITVSANRSISSRCGLH